METDKPIVRVREGELRGTRLENELGGHFFAFRGIPYGKPPVGELRFKDSVPVEPWTGVLDATAYRDVCGQIDFFKKTPTGTDDCLHLSVFTNTMESRKVPVMVWIHGGGFVIGNGHDELYGPDILVRKDIVLVCINYRLGVLGFLNVEHEEAPGNQGLKDQVLALKWIKENIASFGGDPENITIFGESAGGAAVHYHLISPLSQGLFHKAIVQSGTANAPWGQAGTNTLRLAYQMSALLGKKTYDPKEIIEFLRTVDVIKLIEAQEKIGSIEEISRLYVSFIPTLDLKASKPFLVQSPLVLSHQPVHVPMMIGYVENEGAFFTTKFTEEFLKKVNENFEYILDDRIIDIFKEEGIPPATLRKWYFGDGPITKEHLSNYADFLSDVMFLKGNFDVIDAQMESSVTTPTYLYEFCYDPKFNMLKQMYNVTLEGATHAGELSFLFRPQLPKSMGLDLPFDENDMKMAETLCQLWTDFATTGNPTPKKTELVPVTWKALGKGKTYDYFKIGKTLAMESMEKGVQRFNWMSLKNKL